MSKCILCGKKEATVPDREVMSRRKKVCIDCHRKRLAGDVQRIIDAQREMLGPDADYFNAAGIDDIGCK